MNTSTLPAQTALGTREEEARRIARAEGFAIIDASEDWTFFTLDDGQTVAKTEGQWPNIKIVGEKVIRTHFEWVEEPEVESGQMDGRFEGFVS